MSVQTTRMTVRIGNKLEYSADKFAKSQKKERRKHSSKKAKGHKHERSQEVGRREKDYFQINRKDRKNTLSGHKRTYREISKENLGDSSSQDKPYKRRSVSNGSEINIVNHKESSSTMIKITNNVDRFLQNYSSAKSGDSSGSKNKDKLSLEHSNKDSNLTAGLQEPTHVRFNSLVDVTDKFNNRKKLGLFYNSNLSQTQNIYGNYSDQYREMSESNPLNSNTFDNVQGNQGRENKENIPECPDSLDKEMPDASMPLGYGDRICKTVQKPQLALNRSL